MNQPRRRLCHQPSRPLAHALTPAAISPSAFDLRLCRRPLAAALVAPSRPAAALASAAPSGTPACHHSCSRLQLPRAALATAVAAGK